MASQGSWFAGPIAGFVGPERYVPCLPDSVVFPYGAAGSGTVVCVPQCPGSSVMRRTKAYADKVQAARVGSLIVALSVLYRSVLLYIMH